METADGSLIGGHPSLESRVEIEHVALFGMNFLLDVSAVLPIVIGERGLIDP